MATIGPFVEGVLDHEMAGAWWRIVTVAADLLDREGVFSETRIRIIAELRIMAEDLALCAWPSLDPISGQPLDEVEGAADR